MVGGLCWRLLLAWVFREFERVLSWNLAIGRAPWCFVGCVMVGPSNVLWKSEETGGILGRLETCFLRVGWYGAGL